MISSKSIMLVAVALAVLLIPLSCNAQDDTQITCQPEPVLRPAVRPSNNFWRTHPDGEFEVQFRFHVTPNGSVSDVQPLRDDYHRDYVNETVKAVRKWTFKSFACAPDGVWLRSYVVFISPGSV
jgi:hypothetical protein